jgi:hypothetical protein
MQINNFKRKLSISINLIISVDHRGRGEKQLN